jgi:hypothetical protein
LTYIRSDMIHLYHQADPNRRGRRNDWWPFAYLHGAAEIHNEQVSRLAGWEPEDEETAADLFVADCPMPDKEGEYEGMLYGMPVVIVLSRRPRLGWLCGRISCPADEEGSRHARSVREWA